MHDPAWLPRLAHHSNPYLKSTRTSNRSAEGVLETRSSRLFQSYAKSWLVPDVVASFPFNWFNGFLRFEPPDGDFTTSENANLFLMVRVLKLVKLLRLLRIARFFRYLGRWERLLLSHVNSNVMRLLKLLFALILFSHWNACLQFFLGTLDTVVVTEIDPVSGETLYRHHLHPDVWVVRAHIDNYSPVLQWSWSFYHATTQLLAISDGIVQPQRPAELWVFLTSVVIGAALYAVFVATLTAVLTEMGASGKEYRSKVDMLHQYMRNLRMPEELRHKLLAYYELCYPTRQMFHESDILDQLSTPLRTRIALLKCHDVLAALRVLHDDRLSSTIALYLERVVFVDEDFIIRSGDFGKGMFFISAGAVEVFMPNNLSKPVTTLGRNAFFGEMSLLDPDGRVTADARVKGYCEGYFMSRENFTMVLALFPQFRAYIEMVARMRLEAVKGETPVEEANAVLSPIKRRLIKSALTAMNCSKAATTVSSGAETGGADTRADTRPGNGIDGTSAACQGWKRRLPRRLSVVIRSAQSQQQSPQALEA